MLLTYLLTYYTIITYYTNRKYLEQRSKINNFVKNIGVQRDLKNCNTNTILYLS